LLFFALLDFVYCVGLMTRPRPYAGVYASAAHVVPLWVWAYLWAAVGIILFVGAFSRGQDTWAFVAAMALKMLWGSLGFFAWINGDDPFGYLWAVVWFGFAYLVHTIAGGIPTSPGRER